MARTNESFNWTHDQNFDEYVDFSTGISSYEDEGRSAVELRLTFNVDGRSAYIVLTETNDSSESANLLGSDGQINVTWDEGMRLLGDDRLRAIVKDRRDERSGLKLRPDDPLAERLKDVVFVVEASSFEQRALWNHNTFYDKESGKTWENDLGGQMVTIGHVADRPICVSLSFAKINGRKVLFTEITSELADYKLLDRWLEVNCSPTWDSGARKARCDAGNFHHCLQAIRDLNGN